jgi:hypothetical protein
MARLWVLLVPLLLVITPRPVRAGEPGATFGSRLSCRYSSFAVAEVKIVHGDSIDVAFTKDLLRRPPEKTARIRIWPRYDRYTRGEKLLVNAWHFPAGNIQHWPTGPDRTFPSSFYHGRRNEYHVLARIGGDGKLRVVYPGTEGILNWLHSTGNWGIRITKAYLARDGGQAYDIVFPDGRQETLAFPVRTRAAAHAHGGAASSRRPATRAGKQPRK